MAYVERDVADKRNAAPGAYIPEASPLPRKNVLQEAVVLHFPCKLPARLLQGPVFHIAQGDGPFVPGSAVSRSFDSRKESEVVEPEGVLFTKGRKTGIRRGAKCCKSLPEQRLSHPGREFVIGVSSGQTVRHLKVGTIEKTVISKQLRAYEQGVPGKGRKTTVRRVPLSRFRGGERKHLPESLPGRFQEIGETVCARAKITSSPG